ncbi:hypothetical protein E2C01_034161 [Portunus trituberculatus]|uniref:Uncharacterized protein n=1 Tax=Portunus trituberculatus TaxID=210409 RepID=A0A5B7F5U6_PORTR|nr:hypothetical protein [Portunus trituberculatus]
MGTPNHAPESPSGEGTKNVPRSDASLVNDPKCFDTSLNFYINFRNIRCLRSNFQYMEHHLSSTKPHHLFLTETQLSGATDSSPFSVSSYFLYSHFYSKTGCCVYVRNDLTCSRAHGLESSEFSTIWLRLNSHSQTKFICAVYLSPNSSDYRSESHSSSCRFPKQMQKKLQGNPSLGRIVGEQPKANSLTDTTI